MADGLDALLAPAQGQGSGLDALLAPVAPAPVAPGLAPTLQGSKTGGAIQGVRDTQNAAAQWLYNMLPQSVQNAGDSADHYLYGATNGFMGTKPGLNFNNAVADQNAQYEAARQGSGRTGIDWMRALGAGGSQAALAAVAPTSGMGAVGAGVAGGALTPVTDLAPGSDSTFAGGMGKNIALGGALGGAVGTVGKGLAGAISPQISATARQLMSDGVQLTPGQAMGGMAKSLEDKLTSVPVVGDLVKGAQNRGAESLNLAAYGRVLAPLKDAGFNVNVPTTAGRDAVESVTTQVKDAYNELVPKLVLKADPQLTADLASLKGMAAQGLTPAHAATFDRVVDNSVTKNFTPQGVSTGQTLQGMLSDVKQAAAGYASDPSYEGRQLGAALGTLQQHLEDALQRSNPEHAAQLGAINTAFANLTRVQTAAAGQGAANGVFSAAQLASAVKGGDKSVRDNAYAQGRALMQDLSDPAKEVMQSGTGNSGTADRAMSAGALGALLSNPAHLLNPAVLGAVLPTAAIYSPVGQRVMNAAVQPRSAQVQALAEALRKLTDQSAAPVSAGALSYGR